MDVSQLDKHRLMELIMPHESLSIPQKSLLEILKFQPESVLIQLFDSLFVNSDSSPLTEDERNEIAEAKVEYSSGETILWKK